jgi:predicted nucleotidyltransferase component of viral defense system
MAFRDLYRRQSALLIRVLPDVAQEQCFALKGGTAINLFIRDMPRLSVDIDLTFLGLEERAESLTAIDAALRRTAERLRAHITARSSSTDGYRPLTPAWCGGLSAFMWMPDGADAF